ncbi:MAG: ATP-binding cassette domain-containing protein [Desulfobacteraceae bacterium]|nr:ATP-binding cassette domain-containing protein [Desulfobacteraceae bacterium]
MTTKDPIFHLKDISHFYGDTKVLEIDDLKIEKGSITGLIGPNGSGKSTLLKLLAFAQQPTFGQIFYKGKQGFPFSPLVRSKVTLLTQKPYLLKRTVFENIAYGLKIRKETVRLADKVREALDNVGLDYNNFAQRKWHELSGGEAQRVAMAARLILKPEVLLLDEPIASVDTESAKLIRQASLNARDVLGTTLVVASHDLQWLYSISDNQLSIFKGNIFSTGMENIITGPFENIEKSTPDIKKVKKIIKKLADNQSIVLNAPENNECTAIIRKQNIAISLKISPENDIDNQLSGHVISMLLEKKRNKIMATISVHDLSFVLIVTPDQISSLDLYPGKKIILQFSSNDVEWI